MGSVDLLNSKATAALSRTLASRRTIALLPNVAELLKNYSAATRRTQELHFHDGKANPLDQSEFARGFHAVLRVLKNRQRQF